MATAAIGEDQGEAGEIAEGTEGARPDGERGDAWDDLRDKTKASVGDAVEDAVGGAARDLLGDKLGAEIGEKAGDIAEKAVDAAFDNENEYRSMRLERGGTSVESSDNAAVSSCTLSVG